MKKYFYALITILMTFFATAQSANATDYITYRYDNDLKQDVGYMSSLLNHYGNYGYKYVHGSDYYFLSNTSILHPHIRFRSNALHFEYDGKPHFYQAKLIDNPDELQHWLNIFGHSGWEYVNKINNVFFFKMACQPYEICRPSDYYVESFDYITNKEELSAKLNSFGQVGLQFVGQLTFSSVDSQGQNERKTLSIFKHVERTVFYSLLSSEAPGIPEMGAAGNRLLGRMELKNYSNGVITPIFESVGYPIEYQQVNTPLNGDLGDVGSVNYWTRDDGFWLIDKGDSSNALMYYERHQ